MKKFLVLFMLVLVGLVASAQSSTDLTSTTVSKDVWSGSNATKQKVSLTVAEVIAKKKLNATGGNHTDGSFSTPIYTDGVKYFRFRKNAKSVWVLTEIKK